VKLPAEVSIQGLINDIISGFDVDVTIIVILPSKDILPFRVI
jgi:hypothetical protein